MSETKQDSSFSFIWELGLYIILILVIVGLPFLNDSDHRIFYDPHVYLFLSHDSIFLGKTFEDLVNAYFTISFILLVVLPVIS